MKKSVLFINYITIFAISALLLLACKKDEDPTPTPNFTSDVNDKTVSFTNTSTDATSYEWDFGDDSDISTDVNPVYEYAAYGDYDVRLTATGDGGSATQKITISVTKEWPTITIDDDFSDWDNIAALYTADNAGGTLLEAKVTYDGSAYLYFYIKKTSDVAPVLEIFMNTDNDTTTGWKSDHYSANGADYSLELVVETFNDGESEIVPSSTVYAYNSEGDPDWPWDGNLTSDDVDLTTEYVNNEIEFRLPTSALSGISNDKISLYIWVLDNTWTDSGWLPSVYQDPLLEPLYFSFQE